MLYRDIIYGQVVIAELIIPLMGFVRIHRLHCNDRPKGVIANLLLFMSVSKDSCGRYLRRTSQVRNLSVVGESGCNKSASGMEQVPLSVR